MSDAIHSLSQQYFDRPLQISSATPNSFIDGKGFYVSYNDHDISIYGSDTTALVVGQMEKFYILKGDHRAQYLPIVSQGFDACLHYFIDNMNAMHKFSDKIA